MFDFPSGSDGKASACNVGDVGSIPGSGRSPGYPNPAPPQLLPAGCNPRVWGRAGVAKSSFLKPGPAHNSRSLKCTGLRSLVPARTSRCYQDALGVPALSFPSPVGGAHQALRPRGRQRRHQAPPPPLLSLADITLNTCSLPPFSLQALARQPVNQGSGGSPPRRGSAMPGFAPSPHASRPNFPGATQEAP